MKTFITLLFTLILTAVYGQNDKYQVLLDSAKTLFKGERNLSQDELNKFDYHQIVSLLKTVIEEQPDNAEARYFLGYAYSRINSRDGSGLTDMNLETVYKSSDQFEKVIKLKPKYTGDLIVLDPYSKLTGEWGSMAMSYWFNNKPDSAIWAFNEGESRGGFGNFILEFNKSVLDACSKNAILISSGDNLSFPLWYLQIAENYRPDVSVVDISLLNTNWYPKFLSQSKSVAFDLPDEVLDTLKYISWEETTILIDNFAWSVYPSYEYAYLLRGDRVFLSLLKENKFKREVYFTIGFIEDNRLSLKDYLNSLMVVDQLVIKDQADQTFKEHQKSATRALQLSKYLNLNSPDEIGLFDNVRYNVFGLIYDCLENNENKKAKKLMKLMDKYANEEKYPFKQETGRQYADYLRQRVSKN